MNYRIVAAPDSSKLELEVRKLIQQGWEPLGGVNGFFLGGGNSTVLQAMIQRTSNAQGT